MRKSNREVTDFGEILNIIGKCETMRLGLYGEDYPYVVPLSFGFEADGENRLTLYFHCATEGKKLDLIAKDRRACAEFDRLNAYAETERSLTADYESVVCFGKVYPCEGEEKVKGLRLLLEHCGFPQYDAEKCAAMPVVAVYKFCADTVTGKKRF